MDFGRELFFKMLFICISECVGKLLTRPQNTAALEGSEVSMKCSTDNHSIKLIWKHLNSSSPGNLAIIYTGNKFASSFNGTYGIVTEKTGEFGLKFRANSSMSLYYSCEEPGDKGSGADLIVLQSTKCEHIKDSNNGSDSHRYSNITVLCTIRFKGCWTPELNWTIETMVANHQWQNSLYVTNEYSDDFLISTATVAAHQSLNNAQLKCKLKFTTRRNSFAHCTALNSTIYKTAENVPEYSFEWKSPTFAVSMHSDNNWYFEIKEDAYDEGGDAVPVPAVIVICIVIGFVLLGNALMCRALVKSRKIHLVPFYVTVPRKERSSVARSSGVDNNATGTERVEETGPETGEANLPTEEPGLTESSDVHGREQSGAQKATHSKSTAKTNYVEMRGQITEQRKSGNLKTDKNVISTIESKCSGYERMDPMTVRPSGPPPTPPQTNQLTPESNAVVGRSSYTGTGPPKPPRASQADSSSLEYAQLEFPSVKAAKPVRRTNYENTMLSCVDVYASIDHNAKAPAPPPPPPPPSSLPPPPPSSLPPPSNRPVDAIDEFDEETKTIL